MDDITDNSSLEESECAGDVLDDDALRCSDDNSEGVCGCCCCC